MDKTSQNSTAMPNSRLNAPSIIRKLKSSLLVTMLLGLGLGVVGVVYLIGEYRQVKNNAINELTSLADLKVTQVTNWYTERLEDTRQIYETKLLRDIAARVLNNGYSSADHSNLNAWMQVYQRQDDYRQIALLNLKGEVLLSFPIGLKKFSMQHGSYFDTAVETGKIVFADIHRDIDDAGIESKHSIMSFWIPVISTNATPEVLGVWVLQIDPEKLLYPIVGSMPSKHKTAESILVGREGNSAIHLSEMKNRKDTLLKLKHNIEDNPDFPDVAAITKPEGIYETRDCRGTKVIAATRKIYKTPWFLVVKNTKANILSDFYKRVLSIGLMAIGILVGFYFLIGYLERKKDADLLLQQLSLEQDKLKAAKQIAENEEKFRIIFEKSITGKSITYPDNTILPNPAFAAMLGYEPVEMKQKWTEITHPEDIELTQNVIDHILSGETDLARFTKRYLHRDGSIIWADVNTVLQRDEDGKPLYFISTIQDITQQRQTQQEIMKLNRVYAVISQINEMVVRTREESIILKEACRIAVEFGNFKLAWIGEVDYEAERVIPTLWAGEENGYLNELGHISILDEPLGQGPVGTSVRTGKHCLVNDMTQDPSLEPWRESALKHGFRSTVALPIIVQNKVAKVFSMASSELDFFNDSELKLLEEVTNDIAYALETLELEKTRDKSLKALKESEHRFRALFEHLINGVSVYTPTEDGKDFYIRDINPAGERITNGRREEIVGKVAGEVFPGLIEKGLMEVFKEVYRTGTPQQSFSFNYVNGKLEYWLDNYVLKLDSGELVAIYEDITSQINAESELKEANEYLQNLFNYASVPIVVWDSEYRIERFNRASEHLTQYHAEEVIGQKLDILFPQGSSNLSMAKMISASRGSNWESVEIPVMRKDGQIRIVLWNSANVYRSDGRSLLATMAQGQDITERINAEQEILESEARLREIIDSAPFGAYTYELRPDGSLVMISANLSADRIMGYPNQSLIGKTIQEAFPPLANTEIPELYYKVASQGVNLHLEKFTYHNQENSFEYEVHAIQTGKNRVTAFFMDITERLKAEEAIKQLNEELEYRVAERTIQLELANRELEAFSYSVSHDLRSPLRGIDGWSQALAEDYEENLDEQARGYIDRIRSETHRMSQLIEGMLKLAQIGKITMVQEEVNLSDMAKRIFTRLKEEEPERSVQVDIQNDIEVRGDNNLLEIVLTNLLSNAWKFTRKKESALIMFGKTSYSACDAKDRRTPAPSEHEPVYFIRDNGAGFNLAYANKLFGAFQRMHKNSDFPGTGVGLATVQRIINRHGGRIWATAEPDLGATFYFTLGEQK